MTKRFLYISRLYMARDHDELAYVWIHVGRVRVGLRLNKDLNPCCKNHLYVVPGEDDERQP